MYVTPRFQIKIKYNNKQASTEVPPRFELGSLDSKSRVLTITPWDLTLANKNQRNLHTWNITQHGITQPSEHTTNSLKRKRNICSKKSFQVQLNIYNFCPVLKCNFCRLFFFFLCLAFALSFAIQITLVSPNMGWRLGAVVL